MTVLYTPLLTAILHGTTFSFFCGRISYCLEDRRCSEISVDDCNEMSNEWLTAGSKKVKSWVAEESRQITPFHKWHEFCVHVINAKPVTRYVACRHGFGGLSPPTTNPGYTSLQVKWVRACQYYRRFSVHETSLYKQMGYKSMNAREFASISPRMSILLATVQVCLHLCESFCGA